MPIERRCAIVPGSDVLSPEEAELILRHRKSLRSLAIICSDRGPGKAARRPAYKDDQNGPTWRPQALKTPENRHKFAGHVQDSVSETHLALTFSTNDPRPPSSPHLSSKGLPDQSQSQILLRDRPDNKRKHATEWLDSPRRRPAEVTEDTPHVSELDSDDNITPMEVGFPGNQSPLGIGDKP
ncbi:hypothetical protein MMC07_003450 [Pseudocyphellaria aurata]|nr:hypothetical protein [Pseudocyphellaria aurata]